MSVIPAAGLISFARGVPSPDLIPVEEFADCARAVIERDGRTVLNYGPPAGYGPLREWLGARHGVAAERVIVTPGSFQGLGFLARHLLVDGGRVVVEAPTYDRMLHQLLGLGAAVDTVPLGEEGLDLDALGAVLARRPAPRLLYTMPTFHNPTGRTLPLEQRRALVELAAERETLLCEDNPYGLLRFEGEHPPGLLDLALEQGADEWVVLSSSFSKSVAPGARVGYLVVPPRLVPAMEAQATGAYVSPPILPQAELLEFLSRGLLEPNLRRVCGLLRARHDAMVETLAEELPDGAAWSRPGGGYFLWLDFPPGVRAEPLLARALERGVSFVPGGGFYHGPGGEGSARLAFAFPSPGEIREGVRRLGALVREA